MRKSLLLLLACTFALGCSGATKKFDCGLFSLDYPSRYSSTPIQNSPHMVLKITSDDSYFSASYWINDLDTEKSVWDDDIFERYKGIYQNMSSDKSTELVDISKVIVKTKSGEIRCLKMMFNTKMNMSGQMVQCKVVHFTTLFQGNLFVFGYASEGKYKKGDLTSEPESLLKGLKFKEYVNKKADIAQGSSKKTGTNSREQFEKKIIETIKVLTSQCPIRTDECTTVSQVLLSGKIIMYNVVIDDECVTYIESDDYKDTFKKNVCYNLAKAVSKEFIELIENHGYSIQYLLFDTSSLLLDIISISGKDIIPYCE